MTGSRPKRHREKERANSPTKQQRERSLKRPAEPIASSQGSGSPLSTLSPKIHEAAESRALFYFLTHYIQVFPEEEKYKSYVDHLVPLYLDSNMSMRLYHATTAVSMLALAKKTDTRAYMEASQVSYGKAVGLLREAVADPDESRTDDTLMTAMILGLYDSIDASREAPLAWRHHVDGAFAMLNLRRYDTLGSPTSQKLYWAVKFHAAISHVMRCEPISPYTDWKSLWRVTAPAADPGNYDYYLALVALRLPALRHAAANVFLEPMTPAVALEILKLLGNIKILDAELACWPFGVPAPWRPNLVGWKHGMLRDIRTQCYPGPVWGYYNWWIANVWNMYRALRLYCQGLIQCCVERLVPEDSLEESPEYVGAVRTQQRMVDEICATVPICLGDTTGFSSAKPLGSPKLEQRSQDDQGMPRGPQHEQSLRWSSNAMSGYFLIWNLETAASIPTVSRRQRAWVVGRLEEVGKRFGIGLATITASELRHETNADATITVTHLEHLPFEPYPDLEDLLEEEKELEPSMAPVGVELKLERCIADLARRYSELQDM